MKKRFTIACAALLVFGWQSSRSLTRKRIRQLKHRSGQLPDAGKTSRIENAETDKEKDSCGMADCCKDGKCSMGGACCKSGDSCPMKDKENSSASVDYSKITFSDDAAKADCCATGASCCAGGAGACCKGKHS
jgi:hypothetical protein